MRVNLISGLDENAQLETLKSPNQVYAWFLRDAFVKAGVDARLVKGQKLISEDPPETDHTIVISAAAYTRMRNLEGYKERLRRSTEGKLVCYANTNAFGRKKYFDYVFTQISPLRSSPEKFVYAGWGVDPEYCYPEQGERAAFLDSKAPHKPYYKKHILPIYEMMDQVLPTLDLKVYHPVPIYNKSPRLPWPQYQAILRKCHYFLPTQYGDGGLTRLEAAACGAMLVVHKKLRRKRTFGLFNHEIWRTGEDLIRLLNKPVDIEANRKLALKHRWEDVVKRIIETLES